MILSDVLIFLFVVAVAGGLFALFYYSKIIKQELENLRDEFEGFKKQHLGISRDYSSIRDRVSALEKHQGSTFKTLSDYISDSGKLKRLCAHVTAVEKDISAFKKEYSTVKTDVSKLGDAIKSVEDFGKKKVEEFKKLIKK